ncbi:YebC/PmpR family DNA-binding transcriptional regulator [Coxiella endosymbiont of Amblyomma nuttalli]|uniref:YebC/PmpR family DNA-binding transcriptional regulator n=1 Tax=Coxiella endosymbiont of Amblyomma nuttalli TaxID=2749996 RepID=UPI001BA9859F|nr:YebC/PmpR family DNA-binding transcriptional regulator [Coxiella endosymbiont of Amblyomma nuttalli]QTS83615.1 putative transcriptional regulatory protein [Coxiella endosymbiont of Amblyomma nuttalli]
MAGHSKWTNIRHTKARQDAKRSKVFTKLIREISIAARLGSQDIDFNPRLRAVIDKAYTANMTKNTIHRAIKRSAGNEASRYNLTEICYEGYGPNSVAVMVDCLTDNKNRTVTEVRHAFSKCGGNLGTDGSVAYLFIQRGLLTFPINSDEEKIIEIALEMDTDDVIMNDDGSIDIITVPEQFERVYHTMKGANLKPSRAEITMLALTKMKLNKKNAEQMFRLTEMLEALDDVKNVYSNADYP